MIHLEHGSSGPMHHVTAAFLRKLYYTQKRPIKSGTIVHCVDSNRLMIEQEQEDLVIPKNKGDEDICDSDEKESDDEEEDGKPFAIEEE